MHLAATDCWGILGEYIVRFLQQVRLIRIAVFGLSGRRVGDPARAVLIERIFEVNLGAGYIGARSLLYRPEIGLRIRTRGHLVSLAAVWYDVPRGLLMLVHAQRCFVPARLIRLPPGLGSLLRRVMADLIGRNPPGPGRRQVFVPIHRR